MKEMEPERPIEKLLRVFAKKRRDQAGAPREMPPATRRLLQNEAARRAAKGEENFFVMLLALIRRHAVFAVCLIAFGLAGAWLLLRNNSGAEKIRSVALQKIDANFRRESEATPAASPPPASLPDESALARKTKVSVQVSEPRSPKEESNPGFAASEPKQQPAPLVVPSPKENAYAESQVAAASHSTAQAGAPAVAAYKLTESAKETNAAVAGGTASMSGEIGGTNFEIAAANFSNRRQVVASVNGPLAGGTSTRYSQLPLAGQRESDSSARVQEKLADSRSKLANSEALSTSPTVLASFAVEQSAGKMRIVDGDGSVYTGVVQAGIPPGPTVDTAKTSTPAVEQLRDRKDTAQAPFDLYFRVSGTNQSLKQNIVFTGRFVAATNGMRLDTNGAAFGSSADAVLKNQPSAPRIEGTLLMDDNTKMEIHAVPTGP
jgi:hypothetical protein